jgi:hypothetical protein
MNLPLRPMLTLATKAAQVAAGGASGGGATADGGDGGGREGDGGDLSGLKVCQYVNQYVPCRLSSATSPSPSDGAVYLLCK